METERQEHVGMFEEAKGVTSSRRVFGAIALGSGIIMKWLTWYFNVVRTETEFQLSSQASGCGDMLIIAGMTLLGVSGLAGIFGKK